MPDGPRLTFYIGPSMNTTLRSGDVLQVLPYGGRSIRPGDVIVFRPPGKNRTAVHRVVSVAGDGIRTQGDNNRSVDPWVLRPDCVVGRVVRVQRKSRRRPILGGPWGRLHLSLKRVARVMDSKIFPLRQRFMNGWIF